MSLDALSVVGLSDDAAATTTLWELPPGWAWARASSFATVIGGGTPRDAADPANYEAGGTPWVTPADLSGYTRAHIERGARSLSQRGFANSSARLLPAGTVLFSSRAPVGYCVVASNPVCTNQGFKSLVLRPGIVPEYIRYYILFNRKYFVDNASGTTFKELSGSVLSDLLFPIAPTEQQRRIVARIDELFAEIAEGEAALQRARTGLDAWRRALLKAAVTGELTRDWREANRLAETGADLLDQTLRKRQDEWQTRKAGKGPETARPQTRYPVPVLPSAPSSWELPKTWVWASLDQITRGDRSLSYGVLQPGVDVPNGIPLVRVGDIHDGRVDRIGLKRIASAVAAEYSRTRLKGGELLITLVGAIGRTAVAPPELAGANTARAVGVAPLSGLVNADWVELWFRSPAKQIEMVGKAHEVARKTLNLEDVRSAGIAIPPRAEQDEIVARVKALSASSELESAISIGGGHALRQAVLKAAFEGSLAPQDPADEPASALLARLRTGNLGTTTRRRRGRAKEPLYHPSLPGLAQQSVDPRVEPAGDD